MDHPVNMASESPERFFRWSRLVLISSVLVFASCGDGGAPGSRDVLASWSLSAEPIVSIGGADERDGYLLHQVVGATRLGDGRIVIANGSTLQLRYYDPQGNHLFDAGGEARGRGVSIAGRPRPPSGGLGPCAFLVAAARPIRA